MRWAVLLAGGSGTRFWPLSTPRNPKQLLPLSGSASSAEEAVERLDRADSARADPGGHRRIAGRASREIAAASRRRTSWSSRCAASTAPALIWATWEAQRRDPEAEVLSLHADWAVGDAAAFRRTADLALDHGAAPTTAWSRSGVVPSRPETGYGYIVPGAPLDESARTVARFSEKPDAATALDLMAAGALWNSGLFAWTARRLLEEVARHTPEVAPAHRRRSRPTTSPAFFRAVTPISIDVGLLERSGAVAVVTRRLRLGRCRNLGRRSRGSGPRIPSGNIVVGPAFVHESAGLHRLVRRRPDRAQRRPGPRRRARERTDSRHAGRARGRHEAAARCASPRDSRHRVMSGLLSPRARCAGAGMGALRRRAADRRAEGRRLADPRAVGSRRPARYRRDDRRARRGVSRAGRRAGARVGADRRSARSSHASCFAPSGAPSPRMRRGPPIHPSGHHRRVGGRRGRAMERTATSAARPSRSTASRSVARSISSPRSKCFFRQTAPTSSGSEPPACPKAASCSATQPE